MNKNLFIKKYVCALEDGRSAVFLGAGMSRSAGFVDWKELLQNVAEELGIEITDHTNLVDLAQYYVNKTHNTSELSSTILNAFPVEANPTDNHRLLASLPIHTYWTTNYDKLIEKSLTEASIVYDVKSQPESLSVSKRNCNTHIFKMNGDVEQPDKAILTRDQFEDYPSTHRAFLDCLSYDLINKTFLFLGLSLDDPNLRYVFKYARQLFHHNQRMHYYITKRVQQKIGEDGNQFRSRQKEQEYFIQDLLNYGIETVLIDDYNEIADILYRIKLAYLRKTVFISGAATVFERYSEKEMKAFVRKLSASLIQHGFRIVNGYGLGFGNEVIAGATIQLNEEHKPMDGNLIICPFPQGIDNVKDCWTSYRNEMISRTGVSIFLMGNKNQDGNTILSNGMLEEYEISKSNNNFLIPVGATGYMAEELWNKQKDLVDASKYPSQEEMVKLGDSSLTLDDLHDEILKILSRL